MGDGPFSRHRETTDDGDELNRSTLVDEEFGLWERPAMAPAMAFLRYLPELRRALKEHSADKFFLSVVDSGGEANRNMVLSPGETIIVGRHTKCDLVVEHRNVALRQLAIHVAHSSTAQRPLVRVWDLHTGKSLTTEDANQVEALASNGPTFLALGRYHIALMPLGVLPETLPLATRQAWQTLPRREFVSTLAEGTGSRLLPHKLGGPEGTTSVTKMRTSITLDELEVSPVSEEDAIGTLIIQGMRKRREFLLGEEHLERGILVGRYDRCLGRGLDLTVSRVHLMLACVGGDIIAIDAASTVGCKIDSKPISSVHLERATKIWMGKYSYLIWRPNES
jgi:hypothetical protein